MVRRTAQWRRGTAMWLVLAMAVGAAVGLGALAMAYWRLRRRVEWMERRVIESTTIEAIHARAQGRRHLKALGVLAAAGWAAQHLRGRPAAALAAAGTVAAVAGLVVLLDTGDDRVTETPATVEPPRHRPPSTTVPEPPVPASGAGEDAAAPVVAAPSGDRAAVPPGEVDGGGQPAARSRPGDPPPPTTTTDPPSTTEPPPMTEPPPDIEPPSQREVCGIGLMVALQLIDVDVCVGPGLPLAA